MTAYRFFSIKKCHIFQRASECADFDRPQPALHFVADPIRSTRWHIFTVLRAQPLSSYAAIIALAPKRFSHNF